MIFKDLIERPSIFAGRAWQQISAITFTNQDGLFLGGLFIRVHGPWYAYLRRHPAAGLPNAQGIPEPPEAVYWDHDYARQAGVPFAYDYGPERISWLAIS